MFSDPAQSLDMLKAARNRTDQQLCFLHETLSLYDSVIMRHSYFDTGFLDNHFTFIVSSDIGRTLKILKLLNLGFGVLKDVQNAELVRELADAIPLQLQGFQNLKGFLNSKVLGCLDQMRTQEYRATILGEMRQELEENLVPLAMQTFKLPDSVGELPLITLGVIKSPIANEVTEPRAFLSSHSEVIAC